MSAPHSVPPAPAPAAALAMMRVLVVLGVLGVLGIVLRQASHNRSANRSQEAMVGLLAEKVSSDTSANGAQESALRLRHRRGVGIVVGPTRVAGLRGELVLIDGLVVLLLLAHGCLICLGLGVCGLAASIVLWLLRLWLAIIARVALGVACVVGAVLAA
jgi:hypothetical protein